MFPDSPEVRELIDKGSPQEARHCVVDQIDCLFHRFEWFETIESIHSGMQTHQFAWHKIIVAKSGFQCIHDRQTKNVIIRLCARMDEEITLQRFHAIGLEFGWWVVPRANHVCSIRCMGVSSPVGSYPKISTLHGSYRASYRAIKIHFTNGRKAASTNCGVFAYDNRKLSEKKFFDFNRDQIALLHDTK